MTVRDLAATVRASLTAKDVAGMLGLEPNKAGFCRCPLHGERTASMKLYPGDRGWYCFGCHRGGSVIDLVMETNGIGLMDAIRLLNDEFCLRLPVDGRPSREQEDEARRRRAAMEAEKRKRLELERQQAAAYERYLDVGEEIMRLERIKKDMAPAGPEDKVRAEYIDAVNRLPALRDEAEDLAMACCMKEGRS